MQEKEYTAKQKEMFKVYRQLCERSSEGQNNTDLLTQRVTFYINTCHPGVFDLQDTLDADNMEFLAMAYYSVLGTLPESAIVQKWQKKQELPPEEFRKAVMDGLLQLPELEVKKIAIRNNIYSVTNDNHNRPRQSLKQKILLGGYQLSRKLPNSIKIPLKKFAMKLFLR